MVVFFLLLLALFVVTAVIVSSVALVRATNVVSFLQILNGFVHDVYQSCFETVTVFSCTIQAVTKL